MPDSSSRRQDGSDTSKLEALREQFKVGLDELERDDFIEIDEVDLDKFLDGLTS